MKHKLFIDDLRMPHAPGYDVARSVEEAMDYVLRYGCPTEIAFDFNLGWGRTVMPFIKWLIKRDEEAGGAFIPKNFTYTIHSNDFRADGQINGTLGLYLDSRD